MKYFYAAILGEDDTPGEVEFGYSATSSGASAIALRLANSLHQDTCVCESKEIGCRVIEKIRYKNELALAEKPQPDHSEPQYLSRAMVGSPALEQFIRFHTARGYSVCLTRCMFEVGQPSGDFVNAVARR